MSVVTAEQLGVRRELRKEFDSLPENIKLLYSTKTCAMCGAHLTIRQLNRVIDGKVPPVCLKDYKKMQEKIELLAPLFAQLSLF